MTGTPASGTVEGRLAGAARTALANNTVKILILAGLYIVTGRLGLFLAVPPGFATIIWPPSGIALGMLIMHGRGLWPGILIGSFLLNAYTAGAFASDGIVLGKLPAAMGIAVGSTLQALAGWMLVRRFVGIPLRFNKFREIAQLFLLCGPLACTVAASVGVASLYAAGVMPADKVAANWLAWWAGDLFGIVVFLPILLMAPGGRTPIEWRGAVLGRAPALAVLLVLIPLGLTFYSWKIASQSAYDHSQEQFRALTSESEKALLHRLDGYSSAMIGAAAYRQETPHISSEGWREYVAALDIARNYPGINGLGWVQPVEHGELDDYSAQLRQQGVTDFAIKRAAAEGPHYIITYLEPYEVNARAIGLDVAFEPRRRLAAEAARDSGKPALTRKIVLVQDQTQQPGFLIFHPVYGDGMAVTTVAERRDALAGWIYAPFVARNLFADLTASQGATINLQVYDEGYETPDNLIYASNPDRKAAAFAMRRMVTVGQSQWLLVWESTPQFESSSRYYNPIFILVGGLLFSGMFAMFVFVASLRSGDTLRLLAGRHRFALPSIVLVVLCAGSAFLYYTLVAQEERFVRVLVDKDSARIEQLISGQLDTAAGRDNVRATLPAELRNAYRIEVREGGRVLIINMPEGEALAPWSASRAIIAGDRAGELRVTPTRTHVQRQTSIMPVLALIAGLLISALSALSVQTLVVLRHRSRALEELHRRATDQANRASTILNTVLDGVITVDESGLIEDVNPAAERIFGYDGRELQSRNLATLLPDPNWLNSNGALSMFELGHKHNLGVMREIRGLRRDGAVFAIELTVNEMALDGRQLFVCTVKDVSERKRAEDQKRAQRLQLESIGRMLENSVNEIFILDLATLNFLQVNRGGRENLGYTLDELRGMTPLDINTGVSPEAYRALIEGLLNGRDDKLVFGARHRRKGGTSYDAEVHIQEGIYEGRPALFQIVLDVTERNSREEALRTSEETFRSAMENASIGMALVDLSGRWLRVNTAACELLGYSADELLTNDFQSLTVPEDLDADMALIERALAGEINSYALEKRYMRKDGRIVWTQLTVSLVRDSGQPRYFISQIQDITERKEMERLKSEFISVVSHELRTPLTAIRGSLGLLAGLAEMPEKATRMVELARKNCERLIPLINDILDIDRIASGQMRLDLREEVLADLVARSVEANQPYAQRFGVSISLAAIDPALRVSVDAARFEQALTNLLSNAAKFSSSGQTVEVTVTPTTNKARIDVRDHGQGISDEFRQHIFGRFSQADSSSTRSRAGTGLGLHITRGIVEHMGGEIGFDSEPGVGSTFWIAFPLVDAAESRPAA